MKSKEVSLGSEIQLPPERQESPRRTSDLIGLKRVLAAVAGVGVERGRDDDRIRQRAREEGRGGCGLEVMVGVAVGAVDHDERAMDVIVLQRESGKLV